MDDSVVDNQGIKNCALYCNRRPQNCDRSAMFGIMCHSNYDIPLPHLADAMQRKRMMVVYGSLIFSPEIFMYSRNG